MIENPVFSINYGDGLIAACQRALVEIDLLPASRASMGFIEFIRKNFLGFSAGRTLALKRFEILELFIAWAMLWCRHGSLLLSYCCYVASFPVRDQVV
jgi:hypothetical protein